jgi:putative photosynthetic complex assembly protein 2
MELYIAPVLITLFIWWSSTGVIIYLANLPPPTFIWTVAGATIMLIASLFGLALTRDDTSVMGAYLAFVCGLCAWAWQDVSYYTGVVTGVRKEICPPDCTGLKHFWHAIETNLWHELAIIGVGVLILAVTWEAPNPYGWASYVVLWVMQQSAKLNVFLGARNMNENLLPPHLFYLKSFFNKKPMNGFFPFSVTFATLATAFLIWRVMQATTAFEVVGTLCVVTMMVVAVIEHWLLMLPIPFGKLWEWGLKARNWRNGKRELIDVEIQHAETEPRRI